MTPHELAAALEREACGHACQCTGCNNIRLAAQRLRELEAVRVAAVRLEMGAEPVNATPVAPFDIVLDAPKDLDALRAALARVGGET